MGKNCRKPGPEKMVDELWSPGLQFFVGKWASSEHMQIMVQY